jgi:hypothetical protein
MIVERSTARLGRCLPTGQLAGQQLQPDLVLLLGGQERLRPPGHRGAELKRL